MHQVSGSEGARSAGMASFELKVGNMPTIVPGDVLLASVRANLRLSLCFQIRHRMLWDRDQGHMWRTPVISPRGGRTSAREHFCRGSGAGGHRVLEMLPKTCICALISPGVV